MSFTSWALKSQNAIWGTIVSPKEAVSGVQYKYFVYFEEKGQAQAYPIDTSSKELTDLIEKNKDQKVRIQGDVKEVILNIDGPKKKMLVFIPRSIKALTLSELALSKDDLALTPSNSSPKSFAKKERVYDGGGIRISDKAANAMIYTGAAVILGSQLGKILFKKH